MFTHREMITIRDVSLEAIELNRQRVVTLAMVDRVHDRPEGTASRNFRENRERFVEGEDFFELTADEIRRQSFDQVFAARTVKGLLLTESGYLMLVKSFTDNLAWQVQRELVKGYFRTPPVHHEPIKFTIAAAKLFRPLFQAARMVGCDRNAAAISANQAVQRVTGSNLLALLGQTHLVAEHQQSPWFTPTELGRRINVSGRQFNLLLVEAGLQTKQGDAWIPTARAQGCYRLFDTSKRQGRGTPVTQTTWAEHVLARMQPMQVSA